MKVTYLNHSGFLLEWEQCYWIFDYYKGSIPPLDPKKDIFVFCSHSHEDHFNPLLFDYLDTYPSVIYVFADEVRNAFKNSQQTSTNGTYAIHFLKDRTVSSLHTSSGKSLQIYTLKSTDLGCAFFIQYNNKTIYHAGDLHWWHWDNESDDWNKQMTASYKEEMQFFDDKSIDLAFILLDPRQEKNYALGMNYFLKLANVKHVFPMHFWNDFNVISRYLQEYPLPSDTTFYVLQLDGQTFEIML